MNWIFILRWVLIKNRKKSFKNTAFKNIFSFIPWKGGWVNKGITQLKGDLTILFSKFWIEMYVCILFRTLNYTVLWMSNLNGKTMLFFVTGWICPGLCWNPVLFSSLSDWSFLSQNCAFGYGMISDLLWGLQSPS